MIFPRQARCRLDLRNTCFGSGEISSTLFEERARRQPKHRILAGGGILSVCERWTSAEQRPF